MRSRPSFTSFRRSGVAGIMSISVCPLLIMKTLRRSLPMGASVKASRLQGLVDQSAGMFQMRFILNGKDLCPNWGLVSPHSMVVKNKENAVRHTARSGKRVRSGVRRRGESIIRLLKNKKNQYDEAKILYAVIKPQFCAEPKKTLPCYFIRKLLSLYSIFYSGSTLTG